MRKIVVVGVIFVVIGFLFGVWMWQQSRFDRATWQHQGQVSPEHNQRWRVTNDLVQNYLPIGMACRDVEALLGAPDWTMGTPQPSDTVLGYAVGMGGDLFAIDEYALYVTCNGAGRLVRARVGE